MSGGERRRPQRGQRWSLRWGLAAAVAVGIAAVWTPAAHAQTYATYKVKKGDTLELLGAEYYGKREYAIFIIAANQMQHARPLKPGERLKIPLNQEVTAEIGDSLESLAQAYLGDRRRAKFLAGFNELAANTSLAKGQVVHIPFHVRHRAAGKESLRDIALGYFRNAKRAQLLQAYNFLSKTTLVKGDEIDIPIYHVQVQRSKLPKADAATQARSERRQVMLDQARAVLPEVRAAWRAGDYDVVKRTLTQIETEYLDAALAVEVGVLLGGAYVAFDDPDSAIAAFQKALARKPKHALDPYAVSPKIREVWIQAGGTVQGDGDARDHKP